MATFETPLILPQEEKDRIIQESNELLSSLQKEEKATIEPVYQYKGFWYPHRLLLGMLISQKHFKARDTDLLLVTVPKSGTTWLKALAFSIVNRTRCPNPQQHPLLTTNPHKLVPFLEVDLYEDNKIFDAYSCAQSPALISTHLPYSSLPESVKDSNCKIVYLCRNPRDVLVSFWYFASGMASKTKSSISVEEAFEMFCTGASICGPYWEHVLEYWKASLGNPQKVLFLKYEDLKKEPVPQLKRLAEFVGCPFTPEEDEVIQDILQLCSFESLSNLEVNKGGQANFGDLVVQHKLFFRRGEVGDSANHLTTQMIEQLDRITEQKFQGSGLTFEVSG